MGGAARVPMGGVRQLTDVICLGRLSSAKDVIGDSG